MWIIGVCCIMYTNRYLNSFCFGLVPFSRWLFQLPQVGLSVWRRQQTAPVWPSQNRASEVSTHSSLGCLVTKSNSLRGWGLPSCGLGLPPTVHLKPPQLLSHAPCTVVHGKLYTFSHLCLEQSSLRSAFIGLIPVHLSSLSLQSTFFKEPSLTPQTG